MYNLTLDTIFEGRLQLAQPREGYRFSVDAVLLAHFAGPLSSETVLDLGAGCGVIALILASRFRDIIVHGVEVQADLAEIARRNVRGNGLEGRVKVHAVDMRQAVPALTSGPVDLVVCNPPFHPVASGRLNPDSQRAVARHELKVTLSELLDTASRMLRSGGRFAAIYPVGRKAEMLMELQRAGLPPRTLRMVYPKAGGVAKLFLVEGVKNSGATLEVPPPLVIYDKSGVHTEEVAAMFLGPGKPLADSD
jgi:tRNA1Val (adenine37-N6)-methyltransferase